ncbi:ABC transporter ATP-binding protein (plasmid) [Peteryoungia desertarenae]|uniref:ABC transporter ATP-binding protein n=1 Tax=Peteryoungia desertarenae TaxID=1813451 RepID=A0ABX6QS71_9HYPH|nr:ABC transporter ATP-binding protein [Peteryoungia desertarenae]QLF71468.1 ABC transporter ATP-binding protein [Peteryoungia desertarenae]
MTNPVLLIENLEVSLPSWSDRRHAVSDVSLTVEPGEILCIVGESGSGKSMMGKSIMGLLPAPHVRASAGRIMFEGRDLLHLSEDDMRAIRGGRIAMIFQEPMTALNPLMKVGRQIDEVLEIHTNLSVQERRKRVEDLINDVHLPDPQRIIDSYPHQLSGGQRQRVVIAMALALEPALIIADEPTTALDVTTQAQILHLIKELQRKHATSVLFITHDFGVVAEIADRVAVMRHGKVLELGSADEVLKRPKDPYTQALVAAVPGLKPRLSEKQGADPLLIIRDLEKTYTTAAGLFGGRVRTVKAVQKVNLSIPRQSSLALVGESGSGKSTLARCIISLEQPDGGEIILDGNRISGLTRKQLRPFRRDVQMIFQDPYASLNPRQKVGDIISMGPVIWGTSREQAMEEARNLLELVGLKREAAERYPHEFSGGQRQRICIARALATKPKLVVADEPVSALDVSVQKQVLELLDHLRKSFGLSMLFITHDLRVAATVCEQIAILQRGEIVEQGETASIFANPQHQYTQTLLNAVPGKEWINGREEATH